MVKPLLSGEKEKHLFYTVHRRKDGTLYPVEVHLQTVAHDGVRVFVAVILDITERQQAEEAKFRLAAVVESSDDAILSKTLEGIITSWNAGAKRMYGYTAAETIGKSVTILIPPHLMDEEPAIIERLKRGERIEHYETVRMRKDGTLLDVALTVSPIKDASGKIIGASKIARDITERKRSEEALRTNEAQLRVMADSIAQLAWMAEPDGHIFWYNRRWYEYTGTTFEQMEGWGWQSVHDPQILPLALENWKAAIAGGEPFEMEFPLRGADGVFRWFLTRANPVRDAQGRVVRWFGTNTDVDEVRRVRVALQEETRVLELLNKTGATIAAQIDLKTLVQTVTDAATELTGAKFGAFFYNVTNPQGKSFLLYALSGAPREAFEKFGMPRNTPIFHPTFAGESVVRSSDITKDPRYGTMPPHHGMPKGHLPVRSYLAVPVISRSGEVIGGLFFGHPEPGIFTERCERLIMGVASQAAVAIDNARLYETAWKEIAERKQAEKSLLEAQEKLSHHAEELELQVAQRTAHLQESVQSLESVCYTIAHDLRAPLRAVQGFTKIIQEDYAPAFDDTGRQFAERVVVSAMRMDTLIRDLLDYAKLSHVELPCVNLDLHLVAQIVLRNMALEIETAKAQIILQPLPVAWANQTLWEQILTNLLGNSLKFVEEGTIPKIEISSEKLGNFVRVFVRDNGIGIQPEYHERVFGMFQRLHGDEKKYPGTGVGLAIVKKGMERMGGRVEIDSTMTAGTCFHLDFPFAKGNQ